jgi:hypothetical protein
MDGQKPSLGKRESATAYHVLDDPAVILTW